MNKYDTIIVGSGAGGGTLAYKLAMAGQRILILERGGWLPREVQNWDANEVFCKSRYVSPDTWLDGSGKPFQPQIHYNVGGATKFYGAALFRLRPQDFGRVAHRCGTSPAWPVSYTDMEPYYSAAEQLYQVHGNHGDDPAEGEWSRQYPHPAVSHSPRIAEIAAKLRAGGYHPFHAPSAVLLNEARPELSACIRCNTCDGHPCLVNGKADADVIAVKPIVDYPNVTLITNAEVVSLYAVGGRIGAVNVRHDQGLHSYYADNVVLAAGAVNTAKILLRSGIANSSGQVGANYMCHNSRAVMAIDTEPNTTVFQKTLALHDFLWGDSEYPYPMGSIQMVGKSCAAAMRSENRLAAVAPELPLREIARRSVDFWLTTEDLPVRSNRVSLTPSGQVQLSYTPNNTESARQLYMRLKTVMRDAGMDRHTVFASNRIGLAGVAHQAGTCRMGDDPRSSVVNATGRSHELSNLWIADASVFPSIGAVNPALTVMAHALRVAGQLLEEESC
jgi:choline dehydrogenase-like flavoprotein